jgi:hypothetical protein
MNFCPMFIKVSTILEISEQKITSEEDKEYPASYHNKEGYLSLHNKKLTFFELKGFLQPKYTKIFEVSFNKIESIDAISYNTFVITEFNGQKHYLTIYNIPSLNVTKILTDLIINDMIRTGIEKLASRITAS